MEKLHNKSVQVDLTDNEIWTLLAMFRDGEMIKPGAGLEQKLITAYQDSKLSTLRDNKLLEAQKDLPDLDTMLAANEGFTVADTAIVAAWDVYIMAITECDSILHYEPLPYDVFVMVLKKFAENYDMSQAMRRIAEEVQILPFEIRPADWINENFKQAIEELKELEANLQGGDFIGSGVPEMRRIEAIGLATRCVNKVQDAIKPANENNVIEIQPTRYAVFSDIRQHIQGLKEEYAEDFDKLREENVLEIPLGDTLQEGRLQGVAAVLDLLAQIEEKYR